MEQIIEEHGLLVAKEAVPAKRQHKKHKDPLAVEVGQRVLEAMNPLGLSRRRLAAVLGVEYQTFSRSLAGWHRLSYEVLAKLPTILCRSLNWIMGLPELGDLSSEEQQLVRLYRAYTIQQNRVLLMAQAERLYQFETELSPQFSRQPAIG